MPEGYAWKRIDYAWSKKLPPVNIQRFGGVPPGDAAPSDHLGIVVEYAVPAVTFNGKTAPLCCSVAPCPAVASVISVTSNIKHRICL
jgi:hypothetical protein